MPVVELDATRGPAELAVRQPVLALAPVPLPHLALHVGRDAVRGRGRRLPPRLLDEPLPLRVLREDEVEAGFEDLFVGRVRARVRKRIARRRELLQELPGDGEMKASQRRGERLHGGRAILGRRTRVGIDQVGQPTRTIG
jgi:hypothetical protein